MCKNLDTVEVNFNFYQQFQRIVFATLDAAVAVLAKEKANQKYIFFMSETDNPRYINILVHIQK